MNWVKDILTCLLMLPLCLEAQYSFHNYKRLTKLQGLPSIYVNDLAEDKHGFIWIATRNGLARYDGSAINILEAEDYDSTFLQSQEIISLLVSGDSLWIGTLGGLSIMDLNNGEISNIPLAIDHIELITDATNRNHIDLIWDVYEDRQSNIWIAQSFGGFLKWERKTKSFVRYPLFPDPSIPDSYSLSNQSTLANLIQDVEQDSIIWAASVSGLIKLNQETGKISRITYQKEDKETQFLVNRKICLYQGPDRTIYSGSWAGGLSIYYPKSDEYIYPSFPPELKGSHLFSIVGASSHELYMNYFVGLYLYDVKSNHFRLIKKHKTKGEPKMHFGIDFFDSQDRAWFASESGVMVSDPMSEQFRWHSIAEYNSIEIPFLGRSLVEDFYPSHISISGQFSDGIYHVNTSTGEVIKNDLKALIKENDNYRSWGMTILDENALLVSGSRKLYTLDRNTKQFETFDIQIPLEFSSLNQGVRDSAGIIWIGSHSDGLFSLNPKKKKLTSYRSQIPYPNIANVFLDKDQNIWMSSKSGHLVYNRRKAEFNVFDANVDSSSAFIYNRNFCSCPNGEIWVAGETEGLGLLSSKHPESGIIQKIQVQAPNGKSTNIKMIACSPNNELWAMSDQGLVKIERECWTSSLFHFDYGIKRWSGLFQFMKSGQLFIGGRDGFYTIDTDKLKINTRAPIPYISKIITNKGVKNRLENHLHQMPVSLGPEEKTLSIEFSAINHTLSSKSKFLYQLEGIDEGWIDPGDKRALSYSYLPEGKYTFKLRAANNENIWSESDFELPIRVMVPWYNTKAFGVGIGLLVLGLIFSAYQLRISQIKKANELKSNFEKRVADLEMNALRAQMNPHFIFNCLNSIEAYVIRNDTRKASEYLNAFGRLVRLILQNSSSSYIDLQDELQSIRLYLELEQMRFKNSFSYEITLIDDLDPEEYEIPPMLIQPFIENAIWHGLNHLEEKGKLKIEISREGHALRCIIEDNGIGRVAAQKIRAAQKIKRRSMGMDITMQRIETLNKIYNTHNEIQIEDLYDDQQNAAGTRITITIPF